MSASISSQQQFGFAGTPNYIAPEMLRSRGPGGYSFNIDVWSLGMTVIEMLTASMPFEEFTNPFAVMFQIAKLEEPPVIPEYFSEDTKSFLHTCLDPNPDTRPQAKSIMNHPFVTGQDHLEDHHAMQAVQTPKLRRTHNLQRRQSSDDSSTEKSHGGSPATSDVGSKSTARTADGNGSAESDAGGTSEEDQEGDHRRRASCELPYTVSMAAVASHGFEACMRKSVTGAAATLPHSPLTATAPSPPLSGQAATIGASPTATSSNSGGANFRTQLLRPEAKPVRSRSPRAPPPLRGPGSEPALRLSLGAADARMHWRRRRSMSTFLHSDPCQCLPPTSRRPRPSISVLP